MYTAASSHVTGGGETEGRSRSPSSTGVRSVLPRWPSTTVRMSVAGWGRIRVGRTVLTRRRMKPREGTTTKRRMKGEEKERKRKRDGGWWDGSDSTRPTAHRWMNLPWPRRSPESQPPRDTHRLSLVRPFLPAPARPPTCYFIYKRVSPSRRPPLVPPTIFPSHLSLARFSDTPHTDSTSISKPLSWEIKRF